MVGRSSTAPRGAVKSVNLESDTLIKTGTIHSRNLCLTGKGIRMMTFIEKIEPPPPLVPLTDDEQLKLRLEAIAREDLWVKNFIDRLAGVVRDMKH
jgi:hypothetical protein